MAGAICSRLGVARLAKRPLRGWIGTRCWPGRIQGELGVRLSSLREESGVSPRSANHQSEHSMACRRDAPRGRRTPSLARRWVALPAGSPRIERGEVATPTRSHSVLERWAASLTSPPVAMPRPHGVRNRRHLTSLTAASRQAGPLYRQHVHHRRRRPNNYSQWTCARTQATCASTH